jgi:hypothetical protein
LVAGSLFSGVAIRPSQLWKVVGRVRPRGPNGQRFSREGADVSPVTS